MSKVKNYMDCNKEKARHRNRINESRRIKAKRIKKYNNNEYSCLWNGYYHQTKRKIYRYEYHNVAEIKLVRQHFDWDHFVKTKEWHYIVENVTIPAHVNRQLVETIIQPVSILRKKIHKKPGRFFKKQFSRRQRRFDISKEDYCISKGNAYRKDYRKKYWACKWYRDYNYGWLCRI